MRKPRMKLGRSSARKSSLQAHQFCQSGTRMTRQRRARYSKIESIVTSILHEHDVRSPPVPIESIVASYGISIRKGPLGDVSGLIVRDGDSVMIGVNSDQSFTRRRFTIAHEYGHFILHEGISSHIDHTYRVNYRSTKSSMAVDVEEIEANFFAASILMPKGFLIERDAAEYLDSDSGVKQLAADFKVSPHAMSLRLANVFPQHSPF